MTNVIKDIRVFQNKDDKNQYRIIFWDQSDQATTLLVNRNYLVMLARIIGEALEFDLDYQGICAANHPAKYVISADDGTHFCLMCEYQDLLSSK